ncbi:MAG: tripartite tricarboxylate transporter TctB family protein, partial [Agrococcus casei]
MTDTVTADDTAAPDDDQSPNPSRTMEIVAAAASLAFMGLVLGLALNISLRAEAGPGQIDAKFWPTVLAITGIGLSLAQLIVAV